jgi:hypothetical protein
MRIIYYANSTGNPTFGLGSSIPGIEAGTSNQCNYQTLATERKRISRKSRIAHQSSSIDIRYSILNVRYSRGIRFYSMLYRTTSDSTFCISPLRVLLIFLSRHLGDKKGQVQKKGWKFLSEKFTQINGKRRKLWATVGLSDLYREKFYYRSNKNRFAINF